MTNNFRTSIALTSRQRLGVDDFVVIARRTATVDQMDSDCASNRVIVGAGEFIYPRFDIGCRVNCCRRGSELRGWN